MGRQACDAFIEERFKRARARGRAPSMTVDGKVAPKTDGQLVAQPAGSEPRRPNHRDFQDSGTALLPPPTPGILLERSSERRIKAIRSGPDAKAQISWV